VIFMENDRIFELYSTGKWLELSLYLEDIISVQAETGDEVQFARVLSYYGITHLFLADQHVLSTIHKQIYDEYIRKPEDVRVRALFSRFLALYCTFAGRIEEASVYYEECYNNYIELDWYMDEAIMLLESIYWFGLFIHERSMLYRGTERLIRLNGKLSGVFSTEIFLLKKLIIAPLIPGQNSGILPEPEEIESFLNSILVLPTLNSRLFYLLNSCLGLLSDLINDERKLTKNKAVLMDSLDSLSNHCVFEPVSELFNGIVSMIGQAAGHRWESLQQTIEMYIGKIELLCHPWYKAQLHWICSLLQHKMADLSGFVLHRRKAEQLFELFGKSTPDGFSSVIGNEQKIKDEPKGFKVTLFGKFAMQWADKFLEGANWKYKRPKELLIYLLLNPNGQVSKEVLIEEFFPGNDLKKSLNRLYVAIHRINRVLQESFGISTSLVETQHGNVRLNQDMLEEVDVLAYRKLLSVTDQLWVPDREAAVELAVRACQIYSPQVVPEVNYLDWLEQYRNQLQALQVRALRKIARFYREKEDYSLAEETYLQLLSLEPLHEGLYEEYIGYLIMTNRKSEAHQCYLSFKRELERELGVLPSFAFGS